MPRLKKILFPIDFSEQCARTARAVCAWANDFKADVTLLHVTSLPLIPELAYPARLYRLVRKEVAQASAKALDDFQKRHFSVLSVEGVLEEGDPGPSIVRYSREHRIDLIMMPTHGYGPFRRFLTGSVTAKVLHDALCPVWTSAHCPGSPSHGPRGYRDILCAVDCDDEAVGLMRWASWLGRYGQSSVRLVHVIPALNETSRNRGEVALRKYFLRKAQEEFAVFEDRAGVCSEMIIRGGGIPNRLAETVQQLHSDLLIVGRGKVRKTLGRLRTHSMAIIRESHCPVLSV